MLMLLAILDVIKRPIHCWRRWRLLRTSPLEHQRNLADLRGLAGVCKRMSHKVKVRYTNGGEMKPMLFRGCDEAWDDD